MKKLLAVILILLMTVPMALAEETLSESRLLATYVLLMGDGCIIIILSGKKRRNDPYYGPQGKGRKQDYEGEIRNDRRL